MKKYLKQLLKQRIYRSKGLSYSAKYDLLDHGYQKVLQYNLQGKQEFYFFKPYFHESARHAATVLEIYEYVKQYAREVRLYLTVKPDIVFRASTQTYAIEVETGVTLKRNKRQLLDKVRTLREDFVRRWFFVVTDRNLVKAYRRYGKTYSKRNILKKIDKILERAGIVLTNKEEQDRATCSRIENP